MGDESPDLVGTLAISGVLFDFTIRSGLVETGLDPGNGAEEAPRLID